MSEAFPTDWRSLPGALALRVDQLCDRFEAAWKAAGSKDQRPRIEDYLVDAPEPERSALLRELIMLDIEQRCRAGETLRLEDYQARFPTLEPHWLAGAMRQQKQIAPDSSSDLASSPGMSVPQLTMEQPKQIGDYRILREIGRGGMGIVYEAEQGSLGRHVALKVLPQQLLPNAKQRQRFEREARSAAKLHHTNIVPVFGVGVEGGLHYYVMQYIQGLGLDAVLEELRRLRREKGVAPVAEGWRVAPTGAADLQESRQAYVSAEEMAHSLLTGAFKQPRGVQVNESPAEERNSLAATVPPEVRSSEAAVLSASSVVLPGPSGDGSKSKGRTYWQRVANIGVQVAGALAYAHQQGVLHRDIKPANLLLDRQGTVWVTDFGLAKAADQQNLTQTGDMVGTLRYMAPEVFNGKADARSEVYALGLTLYELLVLRPAFDEKDPNRLMKQVTTSQPARLDKLQRAIPRDLVTIVHKAMEREPESRYQSARQLAEDLQRFLGDEPIRARRISAAERLARWCRRNKVIAALTATVAVFLVAGTILSLLAAGYFQRLASDETAARTEAEAAKEQLRRQLYISDMNLARQLWDDGAINRLKEVLDNHRPSAGQSDLRRFEWYYWWRAARLHAAGIDRNIGWNKLEKFAVSPDGKFVAVKSAAEEIYLWDGIAEKEVRRISWTSNLAGIAPLGFTRDSALLVIAGPDHIMRRWETRTWTPLPELTAHQQGRRVAALAVSPSGPLLASADDQGEIVLWDTDTWKPFATLPAQGVITSLAFAPDGQTLMAAMKSGQLTRVSGWASQQAVKREMAATAKLPDQTPYQAEITSLDSHRPLC